MSRNEKGSSEFLASSDRLKEASVSLSCKSGRLRSWFFFGVFFSPPLLSLSALLVVSSLWEDGDRVYIPDRRRWFRAVKAVPQPVCQVPSAADVTGAE